MKSIQDYENTIKTVKNSVAKVKFLTPGDFVAIARWLNLAHLKQR